MSSTGNSPTISRPRPVSTLNRPTRRSTGSAPQDIQRSLTAAVRKISAVSMPSMKMDDGSPTTPTTPTAPTAAPPGPAPASPSSLAAVRQGRRTGLTICGLNPTPQVPAVQHVSTTPLSPLSPVFSAVSSEPLQPEQLGASAPGRKLSVTESTTPTQHTPPSTVSPDLYEYGDKYAALADLDSVFTNDPAKAPTTSINWEGSQEEPEDTESQGEGPSPQGHPTRDRGGSLSRSTCSGGSGPATPVTPVGGNPFGGVTALSEPLRKLSVSTCKAAAPASTTTTPPTRSPQSLLTDIGGEFGDKYAALTDAESVSGTTIDWGTSSSSQTLDEESDKVKADDTAEASQGQGQGQPMLNRRESFNRNSSAGVATVGGSMFAGTALPGSAAAGGGGGVVLSSSPPPRPMMMMMAATAPPQAHTMYGPPHTASAPLPPQPMATGGAYGPQVTASGQHGGGYAPPPHPTMLYNAPGTPHPATTANIGFIYPAQQAPNSPFSFTTATGGTHVTSPGFSVGVVPAGYPNPHHHHPAGMAPQGFPTGPGMPGWVAQPGNNMGVVPPVSGNVPPSPSASTNPFMVGGSRMSGQAPLCLS
ncbi:uncharacterized protein LOC143275330 [Babylonia areolata]|uniref:uncharacterized protein LOC143275330 n=1 Tax=Babylonia areolata TaxID=304850 RepID=UPI003FD55619